MQPDVRLEGPDAVGKTKPAMFLATVSDDRDPTSVRLQWFVRERSCPASLAEAQAEPQAAGGTSFRVDLPTEGTYCVGVVVTDVEGASNFRTRMLQVTNQRPEAKMVMLAPPIAMRVDAPGGLATVNVPLYSNVRITGAMSEDDDPKSIWRYQWKVTAPAGVAEPGPCTNGTLVADGPEICRHLDVTGEYMFELVVRDGQAESERPARMKVIADPNALPCFERTEPPHDLARSRPPDMMRPSPPLISSPSNSDYSFRVIDVRDDGHPHPPASAMRVGKFSWQWWWIEGGTGSTRLTDDRRTFLTFPANTFDPGDEIEVRVQYRDDQPDTAYPCLNDNDSDRCPATLNTTCFHRVSWRLRFY